MTYITSSYIPWKRWSSPSNSVSTTPTATSSTLPTITSATLSLNSQSYTTVPVNDLFGWSLAQVIFTSARPESVLPIVNNKMIPDDQKCSLTLKVPEPEVSGIFEVYFSYNPWFNLQDLWVVDELEPLMLGVIGHEPSEHTHEANHTSLDIVVYNALSPLGWGGKFFAVVFQPSDPAFNREVALVAHDHRYAKCQPTGVNPSLHDVSPMSDCTSVCNYDKDYNPISSIVLLTIGTFSVWGYLCWYMYAERLWFRGPPLSDESVLLNMFQRQNREFETIPDEHDEEHTHVFLNTFRNVASKPEIRRVQELVDVNRMGRIGGHAKGRGHHSYYSNQE